MERTVASLVLVTLAAACEPRAPEPISTRSTPVGSADHAAADAAVSSGRAPTTAAAPTPAPGVCVEPWGDVPEREVRGPVPDPACPDDPGPVPKLRLGVVRFPDVTNLEVAVEIAEENDDRMRGLMFRKEMSDGAGMLFIFEEERKLQFWMKNTCIPLDMIFLSADGTIVGIEENTPTLSTDTFGPRRCSARFVLEVNAGWARKNGVKPGQKLQLPTRA